MLKGKKTQLKETKQASEPNTAKMLELSNQEFKATMINMLRYLSKGQKESTYKKMEM